MAEKRDVKLPESNKKDSNLKGEEAYKKDKIPYVINLWGIAGRQEIMEMRRLWQLRIPLK
jgi:hypothetical protein